jgi:hypothetical protein
MRKPQPKRIWTFAIATVFILTAQSIGTAAQATGSIEGIVVQAGGSLPIGNAQVTLSGGAITASNMESAIGNLWITAQIPPDAWMNATRQYFVQGKGMTPEAANQSLDKLSMAGLPPSPDNGTVEDEIFSRMLNNTSLNMGTSPYNPEFGAAIRNLRAANAKYKVITDRSGRFSFRDIPPGPYTVRVERDGYFGKAGSSLVPQTGAVTVLVGAGTTNVEVPMVRGATVSGRIRDERGQPIPNAMVQAFTVAYTNGLPALRPAASNKTNDRGEYSIFWLPGSEYYVALVKASTQATGTNALQQVVGSFYPGTPVVTEALTINVKTGDNVDGVDFIHRPVRPVRISGTITTTMPLPPQPPLPPGAPAQPITGTRQALMMLLQLDSNAPDDVGARLVANVPVSLATNTATFEVEVPPGNYNLYARMPNSTGTTNFTFGRVTFTVRDTEVKGLAIPVAAPQPINGSLTLNGAAPGQTNIRVSLQVDDSGAKIPAYNGQVRARLNAINPDGSFTIPAVLVGHWQLHIEGLAPSMYVADVRQGGRSVFDTGIDVGTDPLNAIQVLVRDDGTTVQGVALDADKRPLPRASVVLIPPENRRQNRQLYRAVTADERGSFTITGVIPGSYKLFAWSSSSAGLLSAPSAGTYFNPKFLGRYESYGRPINVGQGGLPNAEVTAAPLD